MVADLPDRLGGRDPGRGQLRRGARWGGPASLCPPAPLPLGWGRTSRPLEPEAEWASCHPAARLRTGPAVWTAVTGTGPGVRLLGLKPSSPRQAALWSAVGLLDSQQLSHWEHSRLTAFLSSSFPLPSLHLSFSSSPPPLPSLYFLSSFPASLLSFYLLTVFKPGNPAGKMVWQTKIRPSSKAISHRGDPQ